MSLTEMYEAVQAAWVEGRLENVLQRQKELVRLHKILEESRSDLMAAVSEDVEVSGPNALREIDLALDAIQQLYDQLNSPSELAKEKSVQAGHSSPLNSVALGPVLIQAALPCPISSAILPLAAAVAAGSCCLVLLCTESPAVSRVLRTAIRNSLDYEAVGVMDEFLSPRDLSSLYFESVVLQDSTTGLEFATVLRQTNPTVRVHIPALGLPAIFIDRSTPALELAAQWVKYSVQNSGINHTGRMPRICFVDEFVIEKFHSIMQNYNENSDKAWAPLPESTMTEEIARKFKSLFPSLGKKHELLRLTVLQSTDPINAETMGQVARLLTQSYKGILLVPTCSLDHGIDLWNKVNSGMSATATYIFGQDKETWYLARFLKSDHCFINCIPPRSFAMIAPSSTQDTFTLPYRPEDFSTNKAILRDSSPASPRGLLDLKRIAQTPGGQLSYFEQGLIVGLSITALAVSGLVFAIFKGFKGYYQWRG